jgi:hypothetical protein
MVTQIVRFPPASWFGDCAAERTSDVIFTFPESSNGKLEIALWSENQLLKIHYALPR